jgi:co-chaperonin GroES (HSP10)
VNTLLHPVRGRIIVRPKIKNYKSEGGIVLTNSLDSEVFYATVVAAGPGVPQNGTIVPNCCSPGEEIMYMEGAGIPVEHDGISYLILDDSDVIAILHPNTGETNEVN